MDVEGKKVCKNVLTIKKGYVNIQKLSEMTATKMYITHTVRTFGELLEKP